MQIRVVRGILARKVSQMGSESGFMPLPAGVYTLGTGGNGRIEVLRQGKPSAYLSRQKVQEYKASGEIEVLD